MRFTLTSIVLLPLALALSGCAMNSTGMDYNVASGAFDGKVMGGQGPISGATVGVYAYGTGGYGSAATLLASTTTDSSGSFGFSSGAYSCPQANTPLYLLTSGGNTGGGTNTSSVLGIALGTCTVAKQNSIVVNEITTVALAFSMSYYFNDLTTGYTAGADSFGGPSTGSSPVIYSQGITLANDYTTHILVNNSYGGANPGTNGTTIEASKIITIANILAACVNTTGSTSNTETHTVCGKMFNDTKGGLATRPYDTLQAAVQMAQNPNTNVTALYNLIATTPPFAGGLTAAPNDFSIGVSYSASSAGLDVPTGALATLDIDQAGNVWFPSNASGQVGIGLFSPEAGGIQNVFGNSGLVNPTQVAIDNAYTAWVNDYSSSLVSGFSTTNFGTVSSFTLPGYTSTAITINDDDSVYTGIYSGSLASLGTINSLRSSYTAVSNSAYSGYPATSLSGDATGGDGITVTQVTGTNGYVYHAANGGAAPVTVVTTNSYSGQTIFSGNDILSLRTKGTTGSADGLCIFSQQACYPFAPTSATHTYGMAIDGQGTLWITESSTGAVMYVPIFSTSPGNGTDYLNAGGAAVTDKVLKHGSSDGGTMITPYGVAIDVGGNVWALNAGCVGTGCTPGSIVISEIVGAAAPTITPVAYQITQASTTTGTEPQY